MEKRYFQAAKRLFPLAALLFVLLIPLSIHAAESSSDSSACINCHTDLEEMDDYGAAAASAAAAVAG